MSSESTKEIRNNPKNLSELKRILSDGDMSTWRPEDDDFDDDELVLHPDGSFASLMSTNLGEDVRDRGFPLSFYNVSFYGKPLPAEVLMEMMGPRWTRKDHPGFKYRSYLLCDNIPSSSPNIQPRKGCLPIRCSDFFSSITRLPDNRYLFSGTLNGWPGLGPHLPLEVLKIEYCKAGSIDSHIIKRWWTASPTEEKPPSTPPLELLGKFTKNSIKVTLRTPPWAGRGWTMNSPGFCWHFDGTDVHFGSDMLKQSVGLEDEAFQVHMIQHRYARKVESAKDLLTYHAFVLIEWHRQGKEAGYVTVFELAWLNGIGGYRGRANWCHDKDCEEGTAIYRAMSPEMILPWRTDQSEVRIYDLHHSATVQDFLKFMNLYSGAEKRFLDIQIVQSHRVRLTHRSKKDILSYCLNHIGRDGRYSESANQRNCQTFTADFFGFLAGKKGIKPIGTVNKLLPYKPLVHYFIYEADMYRDDDWFTAEWNGE